MEELNSGPPKTNPSSGREEDLNPGPPDYKSSALTTRPRCLHCVKFLEFHTYKGTNSAKPFQNAFKVIPLFYIAHPNCARFLALLARTHKQNGGFFLCNLVRERKKSSIFCKRVWGPINFLTYFGCNDQFLCLKKRLSPKTCTLPVFAMEL